MMCSTEMYLSFIPSAAFSANRSTADTSLDGYSSPLPPLTLGRRSMAALTSPSIAPTISVLPDFCPIR